ncbi:MAG: hypothetical protein WCV84_04620 [Patescibacteria group bacterium]
MITRSYKVLRPIAYNGRHEIGEIVEMPPEDAENIGAEYLVPVTATIKMTVEHTEAGADAKANEATTKPKGKGKGKGKKTEESEEAGADAKANEAEESKEETKSSDKE